jgi:hypothetical protein
MKVTQHEYKNLPETANVNGMVLEKTFIDLDSGEKHTHLKVDLGYCDILYLCTHCDLVYL